MLKTLPSDLPRPVSLIVHIGAGECSELPAYLEVGAAQILLAEAAAEAAARLRAGNSRQASVKVVQAAVSADTSPRPFHLANFPDLSSLRPPTRLSELFPGLRLVSKETVTPVDPVALLRDSRTMEKSDGSRVLVLDAPGESLSILRRLQDADLLTGFDAIRFRESPEPLYKDAAPAAAIAEVLQDAGFNLRPDIDDDPAFPRVWARLDRAALKRKSQIAALTVERDTLRKEVETQAAELARLQKEVGAQTTELTGLRKELDTLREANDRLHRGQEELLKAEGQIRLLRDLFLKGGDL